MGADEFGRWVHDALHERGMSIRAASRTMRYDPAYLSRVLTGKQSPSPQLAEALDQLLDGDGYLVGLVPAPPDAQGTAARAEDRRHFDTQAYVHAVVGPLLEHDNRFGGEQIADTALAVWRAEQAKLDRTVDPAQGYVSAVAEIAQVAGWIAFDAARHTDAHSAFVESHSLAVMAGDRHRAWFAMDMMAMLDVQRELPGAVLRVADGLLSTRGLPPRVAAIARVRRARALAQTGDRRRSLEEMERARDGLRESSAAHEPAWTWWITDTELTGHLGEVLLSLNDPGAAIPVMHEARTAVVPGERLELFYVAAELEALAQARAWSDCKTLLTDRLPSLLTSVTSPRSRRRVAETVRTLGTVGSESLSSAARDVAELV